MAFSKKSSQSFKVFPLRLEAAGTYDERHWPVDVGEKRLQKGLSLSFSFSPSLSRDVVPAQAQSLWGAYLAGGRAMFGIDECLSTRVTRFQRILRGSLRTHVQSFQFPLIVLGKVANLLRSKKFLSHKTHHA